MTSKGITKTRLAVLLTLAALGASPLLSAADASPEGAKPNAEPAPPAEPAPGAPDAAAQAKPEEPAAQAAEGTPSEGDAPRVEVEAASDQDQPAEQKSPEEKPVEPITGAFGLTLGTRFEPSLVEKVLSEKPQGYRVEDKSERQGTLYRVLPKSPDPNFTDYAVATTEDGTIYRIGGDYSDAERRPKCAVTKDIAAALSEKYGKPLGKGAFGEWYAFRDFTAEGYRGIRLYAPRCKRGIYSISYEDSTLTMGPLPGQRQTEGDPAAREPVTITLPRRPPSPEHGSESVEVADPEATTESAETPEPAAGQGN